MGSDEVWGWADIEMAEYREDRYGVMELGNDQVCRIMEYEG